VGRPIVPGYEQANVKLTPDGEIEIPRWHAFARPEPRDDLRAGGTRNPRCRFRQDQSCTRRHALHPVFDVDLGLSVDGAWRRRGRDRVALARRASARIGAWLMQVDTARVRVADGRVIFGESSVTLREVARAWYLQPQTLHLNSTPAVSM